MTSTGLAQLSEVLVTGATGTYTLAMAAYTGEYAFGRRGRIADTSAPVREAALVGANANANADANANTNGMVEPSRFGTGSVQTQRDPGARWGRVAVGLTIVAAMLHLASVTIRGVAVDRVPWGNMYEFTLVVGLIAVFAWLAVLVKSPAIRYLGVFVMMPVLVVMFLAGTLYTKASKLVPALQSYWLAIHVSSVAIAEGILMTSAALTILYLVRNKYERGGEPDHPSRLAKLGSRLPPAATLDKVAYRTVAFAFPIYTFGVIAGAIWAEAAWGRYWGWDPKETWAFIAWVIYATYLHARATAGWKGNRAAYVNLVGFGAMTFNFFVVNIVISGLHSYAGLN
jgi:cytochrome c-type biogenesis protein CcsB